MLLFELFIILITSILTIIISTSTFASSTYTRLSGVNRYETSSKIALDGWTQSNYAVLALGEDYPDALSGAILAARKNSGVLLVDNKEVSKQKELLSKEKITNVIVLGGEGVISSDIATSLTQK